MCGGGGGVGNDDDTKNGSKGLFILPMKLYYILNSPRNVDVFPAMLSELNKQ